MVGKTILHYKITDKLGSGGMGDIYKAKDTKLQRTVVLKFLPLELTRDDEAQQRFIHEAIAASTLDHPNIGTIYEINHHNGRLFIAMAYYEGENLKDKIKSNDSGLKIEEALSIADQIGHGLAEAHSKGIVHRDIKPANILLPKEGSAKIIDFGLAKLKGQTVITKDSTTMGTVSYMSPEQARGLTTDHRSDIWSMGVLFYEMLSGERPFKGEHEQAIMYLIINEEPEPLTTIRSEVPQQLEKIIKKALTKNPTKRYQKMQDMLDDIENVVAELQGKNLKKSSILKQGRKRIHPVFRKNKRKNGPVSLVLLPLKSLSMDAEQEWFTDGMTETLITGLAKISGLRVISRASAMGYKGTGKTPREIAAELGIHYVVEGSVVKMDDQVKISARLVDADSEEYAWAEEYERQFTNILGLQGEIARAIAKQIQIKLTPQEAKQLAVSRSVNPETYEMYLKGMYHLNKYTPDGFVLGLEYLHKAAEKDPDEPLAYAGLAMGYDLIAHSSSPTDDALKNAFKFATRALELDDELAEAHYSLAMVKLYDEWDRSGAVQEFERALELKPSFALALAHYSIYRTINGDYEGYLAGIHQAQKLDPLFPIYHAWEGWGYIWTHQPDKAIIAAEKSLELVQDFPVGLAALGYAYGAKGMYDKAIEIHQKLATINPDFKWLIGYTFALAGRKNEALDIAVELEKLGKTWNTWGLAEIYTALVDKDKAFYWLEQAYDKRHPYIQWLKACGNFDPLSKDPRYVDLAKRMNLRE